MRHVGAHCSSDPLKMGWLEVERCYGRLQDVRSGCFSNEILHYWENFFSFCSNYGGLDFAAQPLDDDATFTDPSFYLSTRQTSQLLTTVFAFKGNNLSVLRRWEKIDYLFSPAFSFFLIFMVLLASPKTLWLLFRSILKVYSKLGCS